MRLHCVLNILYSCKSIASDILMALAIKHVHNLPPHLSYVSTLPDITQKLKHGVDELKQRLIDTWEFMLRASSMNPVANVAACMRKGIGTSVRTSTVI